jgi:adenylate cyclase
MEFRIGVNLGDVIEEEGRIYGDGVNIAARVEAMSKAGGICISGRAYDQVENKLGLEYENLGEHKVKNITRPIQVFRVLSFPGAAAHRVVQAKGAVGKRWRKIAITTGAIALAVVIAVGIWQFYQRQSKRVEAASVEKMAFLLPDKPSIAVLPFVNMSGDPEQEYFSDGLTEEIITALSKSRDLFVIARNSVFTYKDKPVKVQQVSEELGVRYVLEGSVRKASDKVRITAQLIDAIKGHHVWSERYDRDLKDIFAIQDDITLEIMTAMQVKLLGREQAHHWKKHGTKNLQAYLKIVGRRGELSTGTKEGVAQFRQRCEEAIALDPKYALAYGYLGWTHFIDARYGWSGSPAKSIKRGFEYGQKAIALDETLDYGHIVLASIYLAKRQFEKANAEAERAVALNPNGSDAYSLLAGVVGCSGRWEKSVAYGEKSIRLNPFPYVTQYWLLGRPYFMTGKYDKAIETFKKAVHLSPDYLIAHVFLAACYSSIDRQAEAAAEVKEVLRINPKFSIKSYAKRLPFKNKADIELIMAALRKAGLPE